MLYLHACILYIPVEYSLIPRLMEPRDENLHLYDHYCVYCPHKIMCMYRSVPGKRPYNCFGCSNKKRPGNVSQDNIASAHQISRNTKLKYSVNFM